MYNIARLKEKGDALLKLQNISHQSHSATTLDIWYEIGNSLFIRTTSVSVPFDDDYTHPMVNSGLTTFLKRKQAVFIGRDATHMKRFETYHNITHGPAFVREVRKHLISSGWNWLWPQHWLTSSNTVWHKILVQKITTDDKNIQSYFLSHEWPAGSPNFVGNDQKHSSIPPMLKPAFMARKRNVNVVFNYRHPASFWKIPVLANKTTFFT